MALQRRAIEHFCCRFLAALYPKIAFNYSSLTTVCFDASKFFLRKHIELHHLFVMTSSGKQPDACPFYLKIEEHLLLVQLICCDLLTVLPAAWNGYLDFTLLFSEETLFCPALLSEFYGSVILAMARQLETSVPSLL